MIPEKMLVAFKRSTEVKGESLLLEGMISDPSYLSTLSQSLSTADHVTSSHIQVRPTLVTYMTTPTFTPPLPP